MHLVIGLFFLACAFGYFLRGLLPTEPKKPDNGYISYTYGGVSLSSCGGEAYLGTKVDSSYIMTNIFPKEGPPGITTFGDLFPFTYPPPPLYFYLINCAKILDTHMKGGSIA